MNFRRVATRIDEYLREEHHISVLEINGEDCGWYRETLFHADDSHIMFGPFNNLPSALYGVWL